MSSLFDNFCKAVRTQLPNSKFSWNFSAWIGENTMKSWWGFLKKSPYISFVHTSGGQVNDYRASNVLIPLTLPLPLPFSVTVTKR